MPRFLDADGVRTLTQSIIQAVKSAFAKKSDAISLIERSGTTFTATKADGTTFTFDQQDTTVQKTSTTPLENGTAAIGSETAYAAGDHVHPHDSTKVDAVAGKGLSTNDFTNSHKSKLEDMSQMRIQNGILELYDGSNWSSVDIAEQPFSAPLVDPVEWVAGAIGSSNGRGTASTTRLRTSSFIPDNITSIDVESGYRYTLPAYDKSTEEYIGMYNGSSFAKSASWITGSVDLSEFSSYIFKICLARNPDSGDMTTDEKSKIILNYSNKIMNLKDIIRILNKLL